MRRLYVIGFPLLMAFDTLAQLCFKYAGDAALPVEANTAWLLRVLSQPWVYGAIPRRRQTRPTPDWTPNPKPYHLFPHPHFTQKITNKSRGKPNSRRAKQHHPTHALSAAFTRPKSRKKSTSSAPLSA